MFLLLCEYTPVKGEFPLPSLGIRGGVGLVIGAQIPALATQKTCSNLGGLLPGDAGHLHLDAEAQLAQVRAITTLHCHPLDGFFFREREIVLSGQGKQVQLLAFQHIPYFHSAGTEGIQVTVCPFMAAHGD